MNGKTLYKRQISAGVRDIIEEIDALRIRAGFANVTVDTPKVETRLRSGFIAAIPMKLSCKVVIEESDGNSLNLRVGFTYPVGFPKKERMEVSVILESCSIAGLDISSAALQAFIGHSLQDIYDSRSQQNDNGVVPDNDLDEDGDEDDDDFEDEFCDDDEDDQDEQDNQPVQKVSQPITNSAQEHLSTTVLSLLQRHVVERMAEILINSRGNDAVVTENTVESSAAVEDVGEIGGNPIQMTCDENGANISSASEINSSVHSPDVRYNYACMRCRHILFSDDDLVSHDIPLPSAQVPVPVCSSLFLGEAPSWLLIKPGETSNKLHCPNCTSKLGSWGWVGCPCSCGTWVAPAFQISKNKVDPKRVCLGAVS